MKKTYFQPEVQVAFIALESIILAGSVTPTPTPVSDNLGVNPGVPTDEVW